MDFSFDQRTTELREQLLAFMDQHVYPAEAAYADQGGADGWSRLPVIKELQREARTQGLWNLFLPGEYGAGLTNLQYAPLAEILGRSPGLGPEAVNCSAPDTGNMEVLAMFGTPEQKKRWLEPLLAGEIRSSFAMTEPAVASSDATNISTQIVRDGDEYVINGTKWWISGAMNPNAEIFIVMGKTDPDGPRHRQQSQILVPRDTPGLEIRRGMHVFGYDDADHGGHAELVFREARVPASNLIAGPGDGFAIAQARLGPGRIHHCMRLVGLAERALELMCRRALSRVAFGKPLADQGVVRDWIAESRVRIEQLRLLIPEDRMADGHGWQPGRAHRGAGDQGRDPGDRGVDPGQGDPGARRRRAQPGLPAGPLVRVHAHAPLRRRPRRGAQELPGEARARQVPGTMRPAGETPASGERLVTDETARERLRSAAISAFAAKGFHGTTTRDIATRAGLSPAGVYVHYPSKEELLFSITEEGHRGVLAEMRAAAARAQDPAGRLVAMVRAFALWHAERAHPGADRQL